MPGSALSRRVSEFLGVVLFATALFWLIALATYDPADPVWFFNTGGQEPAANFAGRVGAFLAELSYQVVGFTAYLLPVVLVTLGWHCFWCRQVAAVYTKVIGLVLTLGCTASFLSLAFGPLDPAARTFRAGGYVGGWLADLLAEYLNRAGSIIVILTLLFLALILTTQLSFGRLFNATGAVVARTCARATRVLRGWWEDRRREQERQGVLRKHLDRTGASSARTEVLAKAAPSRKDKKRRRARAVRPGRPDARDQGHPPGGTLVAAIRAGVQDTRRAPAGRVHPAAPVPAGRATRSTQIRRTGADGQRAAPRGQVPGVLGRRVGRPDSSWSGGDHLRVQAGTPA